MALLGLASADMTEPEGGSASGGEEASAKVDTARNMRAMAAIKKAGHTQEEAEKIAGAPIADWTSDELDVLRDWITAQPAATSAPSPDEEARIKAREAKESYGKVKK